MIHWKDDALLGFWLLVMTAAVAAWFYLITYTVRYLLHHFGA